MDRTLTRGNRGRERYDSDQVCKRMPDPERIRPAFQFGVFELDPSKGELRKQGLRLKLQDQPLQILVALLERTGEIVTRQEIQKRLWPAGTYVDYDNAINSAVRKLRDALGDSADNPRFVETLARRGYRFIAPVSRAEHAASPSKTQVEIANTPPVRLAIPARRNYLPWVITSATLALLLAGAAVSYRRARLRSTAADTPLPAVPLTSYPGFQEYPSFSPEGTRVAFSWDQPGTHPSNIYVKLIGSGEAAHLTSGSEGDYAPAWSPDGRSIAFLRLHGPTEPAIMVMPAIGGPARELASVLVEPDWFTNHYAWMKSSPRLTWSANGKWLLTLGRSSPFQAFRILRISVETGEKSFLTSPLVREDGDLGLALSPDGRTLAFIRSVNIPNGDLYIMAVSDDMMPIGQPERLLTLGTEVDGLAWTSDGRGLVFSSKRRGKLEIWRMNADGSGGPVRLNVGGDDPGYLAISREGKHLAYTHYFKDDNIWRLGLSGKQKGQATSFISSTRRDARAVYSPDGKRIALESGRSGNEEVWICNEDSSGCVQLTSFQNAWSGTPRWSPDGQKIAFDGNAAGNWDVYVINSRGGKPLRLTSNPETEIEPIWSHDGKWVYYCSMQSGQPETWKTSPDGATHVQVTKNGGCGAFESADGEELYYTNERGFWKKSLSGGEEIRVSDMIDQQIRAFTKHGVYFMTNSRVGTTLKLLDFETRSIRTVAAVPGRVGDGMAISPDERWLLYTRSDIEGSELMLVENFR